MSLKKSNFKKVMRSVLRYIVALFLLTGALFPIAWMLMTSLKTQVDAFKMPPTLIFKPTFANFITAFTQSGFGIYYKNSLTVVISAVALCLLVGVPAAYVLARFIFKGKKGLTVWILSVRIAPPIAFLIPFFIMFNTLNLLDTILGLILIYIAINLTMVVWMMKGFFEDVPREIEEAALVEGCTPLQVFLRVSLPISLTGLAATAVLTFIFCWNELMFAIVLTSYAAKTATAGIYNFIGYNDVRWGELCAASILVIIPVIIFILFVQRYLIRGLSFGAVK